MSQSSTVRVAGPADYQEVWRLFLTGHKENGIFDLAPDKVNWLLWRALNPSAIQPDDAGTRGAIGVIGKPGHLEGLAFLILGSYWYSNQMHLEELLVLVDPEHRKTNHARALVEWMKNQVEVTGLPLVTGIISNHRTEAKCRLYQRLLPKAGEFFFLAPKGSTPALVATSS